MLTLQSRQAEVLPSLKKPEREPFRIAVDAMGSDDAPSAEVEGAKIASAILREMEVPCTIMLVGNNDQIERIIHPKRSYIRPSRLAQIQIIPAEDAVTMDDEPAVVVRAKPRSSMVIGLELVQQGKADAFISAGNTGAILSAATLILGRIRGVSRPTIGAFFPTSEGKECLLLDVGANVEVKPQYLYEFAVMGSVYAELIQKISRPRVGLLNIGEEETKGTEQVRAAHLLLKNSSLNFVGNVEGHDIFTGRADVIVCDGFTGNVVLKFAESIAPLLKSVLRRRAQLGFWEKLRLKVTANTLRKVLADFDYQKYGGVPLLGVNGVVIIGHGKSSSQAISNMILRAWEMHHLSINKRIEERLNVEQNNTAVGE